MSLTVRMCVLSRSVMSESSCDPHGPTPRDPMRLLYPGIFQARILSFPPAGDLPNPGIEPTSTAPPALQGHSLSLNHQGRSSPTKWLQ